MALGFGASEAVWLHERPRDRADALGRGRRGPDRARARRATVDSARWSAERRARAQRRDARRSPARTSSSCSGRTTSSSTPSRSGRRPATGASPPALTPARVASLAGELPLREDAWELRVQRAGDGAATPVMLAEALYEELPVETVVDHKPFRLGMAPGGEAVAVRQPRPRRWTSAGMPPAAPAARDRLRRRREQPLPRGGRLHELRRAPVLRQPARDPRGARAPRAAARAPLGRRDGMCRVPETATVVRDGQPRALRGDGARALRRGQRSLPRLVRAPARPGCACRPGTARRSSSSASTSRTCAAPTGRFERRWDRHVVNWQYVLSPNRFTTPILQRAYAIEGEMLETGYPRNDVLARADRDARGARDPRAARAPRGSAGGALRTDLPRRRPRQPRPLSPRAGARHRPPARGGGRRHA